VAVVESFGAWKILEKSKALGEKLPFPIERKSAALRDEP
jgi:hypothetical protein